MNGDQGRPNAARESAEEVPDATPPSDEDSQPEGDGGRRLSSMAWTQIGAIGAGLILTAVYSAATTGVSWRNLSASAMIELSRRAKSAGDLGTAKAAKDAATNYTQGITGAAPAEVVQDVGTIADRYDELRSTPASPRRTGQMEDLVRRVRAMAKSGEFSAQDVRSMFTLGTPGRRVMALALMEGDIHLADFSSVLQAIEGSQSAFEQYHGLIVANTMLGSLSPDERRSLRTALANPTVSSRWAQDSARQALADTISNRLNETP